MIKLRRILKLISGRNSSDIGSDPWAHYLSISRGMAWEGPAIFLSFDCDTDLDIPAVEKLGRQLSDLNIRATFAVPGAQLKRGRQEYAALAASGFEFMNHGELPHAAWDNEKFYGITFYNEMSRDDVASDIRKADSLIREITGKSPKGFRAPHFGSFQARDEVAFMHRVCAELGYSYASTTIPRYALVHGPAFLSENVIELPVIGSWRDPCTILDSWNYLADRVHYRLSETYFELFEETLQTVCSQKLPVLLTWYADPCHVYDQLPFTRAMELIARMGISSYTGSQCAAMMRHALGEKCAE